MSWMSKHATEHKKNLLDTMPIDDKGSALLQSEEYDVNKAFKKVATAADKANKYNAEQKKKGSSKRMTGDGNEYDSNTSPVDKEGWIQEVDASIDRRGTRGVCTGDKYGSASCPPGSKRYTLATTFKKMAKKR